MTMHAEYVQKGATATRRAGLKNPMELLLRLRVKHSTAGFMEVFDLWWAKVSTDSEMLATVGLHAFRNMWTSAEADERKAKQRHETAEEITAGIKEQNDRVKKLANEVAKVAIMNVKIAVNGTTEKSMRDCTYRDLKSCGIHLRNIYSKMNQQKTVGEQFTEEQVAKLYWGK